MIVIDISKFTPVDVFRKRVDEVIRKVKSSKKAPFIKEILIPGEPEFQSEEGKLRTGIFVEDSTIGKISEIASRFQIEMPKPVANKGRNN